MATSTPVLVSYNGTQLSFNPTLSAAGALTVQSLLVQIASNSPNFLVNAQGVAAPVGLVIPTNPGQLIAMNTDLVATSIPGTTTKYITVGTQSKFAAVAVNQYVATFDLEPTGGAKNAVLQYLPTDPAQPTTTAALVTAFYTTFKALESSFSYTNGYIAANLGANPGLPDSGATFYGLRYANSQTVLASASTVVPGSMYIFTQVYRYVIRYPDLGNTVQTVDFLTVQSAASLLNYQSFTPAAFVVPLVFPDNASVSNTNASIAFLDGNLTSVNTSGATTTGKFFVQLCQQFVVRVPGSMLSTTLPYPADTVVTLYQFNSLNNGVTVQGYTPSQLLTSLASLPSWPTLVNNLSATASPANMTLLPDNSTSSSIILNHYLSAAPGKYVASVAYSITVAYPASANFAAAYNDSFGSSVSIMAQGSETWQQIISDSALETYFTALNSSYMVTLLTAKVNSTSTNANVMLNPQQLVGNYFSANIAAGTYTVSLYAYPLLFNSVTINFTPAATSSNPTPAVQSFSTDVALGDTKVNGSTYKIVHDEALSELGLTETATARYQLFNPTNLGAAAIYDGATAVASADPSVFVLINMSQGSINATSLWLPVGFKVSDFITWAVANTTALSLTIATTSTSQIEVLTQSPYSATAATPFPPYKIVSSVTSDYRFGIGPQNATDVQLINDAGAAFDCGTVSAYHTAQQFIQWAIDNMNGLNASNLYACSYAPTAGSSAAFTAQQQPNNTPVLTVNSAGTPAGHSATATLLYIQQALQVQIQPPAGALDADTPILTFPQVLLINDMLSYAVNQYALSAATNYALYPDADAKKGQLGNDELLSQVAAQWQPVSSGKPLVLDVERAQYASVTVLYNGAQQVLTPMPDGVTIGAMLQIAGVAFGLPATTPLEVNNSAILETDLLSKYVSPATTVGGYETASFTLQPLIYTQAVIYDTTGKQVFSQPESRSETIGDLIEEYSAALALASNVSVALYPIDGGAQAMPSQALSVFTRALTANDASKYAAGNPFNVQSICEFNVVQTTIMANITVQNLYNVGTAQVFNLPAGQKAGQIAQVAAQKYGLTTGSFSIAPAGTVNYLAATAAVDYSQTYVLIETDPVPLWIGLTVKYSGLGAVPDLNAVLPASTKLSAIPNFNAAWANAQLVASGGAALDPASTIGSHSVTAGQLTLYIVGLTSSTFNVTYKGATISLTMSPNSTIQQMLQNSALAISTPVTITDANGTAVQALTDSISAYVPPFAIVDATEQVNVTYAGSTQAVTVPAGPTVQQVITAAAAAFKLSATGTYTLTATGSSTALVPTATATGTSFVLSSSSSTTTFALGAGALVVLYFLMA